MRRKIFKWTLVLIGLTFIGLQFTGPARTNPPFDESNTLAATTVLPANVAAAFARSCEDCHSNKTNWRWYSYVAPVSSFTIGHVNEGRSELNFSVWGTYGERLKHTRLNAICEQCQKGTMPLASYTLIHPAAKLSQAEITAICQWTKQESQRLTAK